MTKAMDELRAALMRTKQFDWWQRSALRWLSPRNEEQRRTVMNALGTDHVLTTRMIRCGEISESNNMRYCGVPLCPRCYMRERGRQSRQAIRETFAGVQNADLAFVTILLPARTDLAEVHDVIDKEKRRLRNFIVRQRSLDSRWDDFQLVGFWEMGRMTFGEFQNAGRKTTLALRNLEFPFVGEDDETVWLPHLHAIVNKGQLSEKEIAKALRNDGHSAPYQVDVRPFHTYKKVAKNLQNVTRYSLKFRIENDLHQLDPLDFITAEKDQSGTRDWWPAKDIRAYAEWLCLERSGFQSLRFVLGKKEVSSATGIAEELADNQGKEIAESSFEWSLSHETDEDACAQGGEKDIEVKAHGISDVDFDALFDVDDHVGYVSWVRYNNSLLDTNWIGIPSRQQPSCSEISCGSMPFNMKALSRTYRSPGNTISLRDRLRSLGLLSRANGDPRSGQTLQL